jgi:predicted SprT family Zn-dependent metalloprotease
MYIVLLVQNFPFFDLPPDTDRKLTVLAHGMRASYSFLKRLKTLQWNPYWLYIRQEISHRITQNAGHELRHVSLYPRFRTKRSIQKSVDLIDWCVNTTQASSPEAGLRID